MVSSFPAYCYTRIMELLRAVLGEDFSKYMAIFSPYLLQVLRNTSDIEVTQLMMLVFKLHWCVFKGVCGWCWTGG